MKECPQLGKLIAGPESKDAVHIAVCPVTAGQDLMPGDDVGFITSSQEIVGRTAATKIGIVDPFLRVSLRQGERFWLFLYPNTITSLRHDWTHPAFIRPSEARATERMEAARVS